jgi:hypothetical protein
MEALIDSYPPIALDKFIQQSGLSPVTVWRYRKAGWLNTLNICGRHYLTRSEIGRFNKRAAAGEFARELARPSKKITRRPASKFKRRVNATARAKG